MEYDYEQLFATASHLYHHNKKKILPHITHHSRHYDLIDLALIWGFVVIIAYILVKSFFKLINFVRKEGLISPIKKYTVKKLRKLPFVKAKIQAELDKTLRELEEEVSKKRTDKIA
jgi:hypothetical protein